MNFVFYKLPTIECVKNIFCPQRSTLLVIPADLETLYCRKTHVSFSFSVRHVAVDVLLLVSKQVSRQLQGKEQPFVQRRLRRLVLYSVLYVNLTACLNGLGRFFFISLVTFSQCLLLAMRVYKPHIPEPSAILLSWFIVSFTAWWASQFCDLEVFFLFGK